MAPTLLEERFASHALPQHTCSGDLSHRWARDDANGPGLGSRQYAREDARGLSPPRARVWKQEPALSLVRHFTSGWVTRGTDNGYLHVLVRENRMSGAKKLTPKGNIGPAYGPAAMRLWLMARVG